MHVDEVELRVVRLPYKSVFKTSFAAETEKTAVIVTVRVRRGRGLRRRRDGHAARRTARRSIPGALHLLREALVPALLNNGLRRSDDAGRLVEGVARQPDGQVGARTRRVGLPRPPTRRTDADSARRRANRDPGRRQLGDEPGARDGGRRSADMSSRATSASS